MASSVTPNTDVTVRVARIGHVAIAVRNLDRTIDFYTQLVGLRLTERFQYPDERPGHGGAVEAGAFMRCDSTHHRIAFFLPRNGIGASGDGLPYGLHHLAFEMNTPRELVAKYLEFKRHDVPIVNARVGGPGNQPRFYVRDPDGHLLEFYWGIDQIGWDGRPRAHPPITEIELERFDFAAFEAAQETSTSTPS